MKKTDTGSHDRRGVLRAGLGILAAGGFARAALAADRTFAGRQQFAQDAEKLAPGVVQYQETPKDGAKCSGCVNFVAPAACKIVSGTINPNGWCVAYAPKEG